MKQYRELREPERLAEYIRARLPGDSQPFFILLDEAQLAITREERKDTEAQIALYGILNGLLRREKVDCLPYRQKLPISLYRCYDRIPRTGR